MAHIKAPNLLTPCSTVLPKKLTASLLLKKFPAFYGTGRFITAFTNAPIICAYPESQHPPSHFLRINFNIIHPSTPTSSQWFLSLRTAHRNPVYISPLPHTCHMPRPSHSYRFDHPNIW